MIHKKCKRTSMKVSCVVVLVGRETKTEEFIFCICGEKNMMLSSALLNSTNGNGGG